MFPRSRSKSKKTVLILVIIINVLKIKYDEIIPNTSLNSVPKTSLLDQLDGETQHLFGMQGLFSYLTSAWELCFRNIVLHFLLLYKYLFYIYSIISSVIINPENTLTQMQEDVRHKNSFALRNLTRRRF